MSGAEGADPALSVVVACYDEEPHLEESFRQLRIVLDDFRRPWEIVFVDDCSRDGTRAVLEKIVREHPGLPLRVLLHERNQGRGATVSDGFRAARGAIAGFLDIDLEVHAHYIAPLVRAIEQGADVATVRRLYFVRPAALLRHVLSRGYAWLVRHLLGTRLVDTESGFKFFRREKLRPLLETVEDRHWFWDTEFMIRAERAGLRIVEVPGAFVRRTDKRSTVRAIPDSIEYVRRLLAFRRRLRAL